MDKNKAFIVKFKDTPLYKLVVESFSISESLFNTLRINIIKFTSIVQTQLRIIQTLGVNAFTISVNNLLIDLLQRLIETTQIATINFSTVLRSLENWIDSLIVQIISIEAVMRLMDRIAYLLLAISPINIISVATIAVLRKLSYYDSDYLSDMDGNTLYELEIAVV